MPPALAISLDQVLACPTLPSLPAVAIEVLSLTRQPNVNLEQIAEVVQNDQAICAKILKTVNSSYYGLSSPCPSITRAISYLGISTVKSLVLGFSLVDCTRSDDDGFDLVKYWQRCIYSAAATRFLASQTKRAEPEEAFIAALLQDVGMPAIHNAAPAEYARVMATTEGYHDRLAAAEQAAFGFDHAIVGSALAERWRLPQDMIEAIRFHHQPDLAPATAQFVRLVALGTHAAVAFMHAEPDANSKFLHAAEQWFNVPQAQAEQWLDAIAEEAQNLARLFQINLDDHGKQTDIKSIMAQAEEASLEHQLMLERETQELRQRNDNLARMAVTDALTGAGNRKQFDTQLPQLFGQAHRMGGSLAVIMVDADKFKNLNDTYGHQAGDLVLIELARRMMEQVQDSGLVCRYGGEEFAIILPGFDRKQAARMAESVRLAIASTPIDVSDLESAVSTLPVTASLGVAVLEPSVASRITSHQMLIRAADKALYVAKESGRNCVRVFTMPPQPAHAAAA